MKQKIVGKATQHLLQRYYLANNVILHLIGDMGAGSASNYTLFIICYSNTVNYC